MTHFARALGAVVIAVVALGVGGVARADGLPDPPVEHCTVAEHGDGDCEACRVGRDDPDACTRSHAGAGWQKRCRSHGLSVWTEVWCRPLSAAAAPARATHPPPVHAAAQGGCDVTRYGHGLSLGAVLAGLALAATLSRRRR